MSETMEEYICTVCHTRNNDPKSIERHKTTPLSGLDTKIGAIFKVPPAVYYTSESRGIIIITGIKIQEDHHIRHIGRTFSIDWPSRDLFHEEDYPRYVPNLNHSNELSNEEYEIAREIIYPNVKNISSKIEISKGIIKLL